MTDSAAAARERILARIDSALAGRPRVAHPGPAPDVVGSDARISGSDRTRVLELFGESLRYAGGEVVFVRQLDEAVRWLDAFAESFSTCMVSARVAQALRPALREAEPARADLGVSVAVAAAAASGSLILSSDEGRALQLLAPVHLVWVDARHVYVELREALDHARRAGALPNALAIHSGPSKSADIGRIVVTGVHGPGRLIAVVTDFPIA